mgnify:FL=1
MRFSFRRTLGDWTMGVLSSLPLFLRARVPGRKLSWKDLPSPAVAPAGRAGVRLLVAPANFAGQGFQWARAAESLDDVSAVSLERGELGVGFAFTRDALVSADVADFSRRWARRQKRALRGFTHVLLEAGIPLYNAARRELLERHVRELQAMGLEVALLWHGTDVRTPSRHRELQAQSPLSDSSDPVTSVMQWRAEANHAAADALGIREFVSTPDLLEFRPNATWLPTIPEDSVDVAPQIEGASRAREATNLDGTATPVVLHAPSKTALKGTRRVREVCRKLEQEGLLQYREVSGAPHMELLRRVEDVDIVVDSLSLGSYGVISLEGMLAGKIAVCNVWGSVRQHVRDRTGSDLPVVQADQDSLEATLRDLVGRRESWDQIGQQGREFVKRVHSRDNAATVLEPFLKGAEKGGAPVEVQVVIPVHEPGRPLKRAVESVLAEPSAGVILVAHGVGVEDLGLTKSERLQIVQLNEAYGFPGNAFNAGLSAAKAPWVGIMGSDDWFEPGAIQAMLDAAKADCADGVLAPLRQAASHSNSLKPVTWRRKRLDAVRDRMFYRTAPLGIYRRELLQNPRYQMAENVVAGVDQLSSVRLWTEGAKISYRPFDPAYVVGDDAKQRVTLTPRPLPLQAEMWQQVWRDQGVLALADPTKTALAEKFVRVHIFDWLAGHAEDSQWIEGDFEFLQGLALAIRGAVPGLADLLMPSERRVFRTLCEGSLSETLEAWKVRELKPAGKMETLFNCQTPGGKARSHIAAALSATRERLRRSLRAGSSRGKADRNDS